MSEVPGKTALRPARGRVSSEPVFVRPQKRLPTRHR